MPTLEGTVDCLPEHVQFGGPGGQGTNVWSKNYSTSLNMLNYLKYLAGHDVTRPPQNTTRP